MRWFFLLAVLVAGIFAAAAVDAPSPRTAELAEAKLQQTLLAGLVDGSAQASASTVPASLEQQLQGILVAGLRDRAEQQFAPDAFAGLAQQLADPVHLRIRNRRGAEGRAFFVKDAQARTHAVLELAGARARLQNTRTKDITAVVDVYSGGPSMTTPVFAAAAEVELAEIALPKTGQVAAILKCRGFDVASFTCTGVWEDSGLPFTDNGTHVIFTTTGFSGFGGSNITILNVQSYPQVGGVWEVRFNTTGTANLSVRAVDGTTWSNVNEFNDLKFLQLECGGQVVNSSWVNDSAFIPSYSCDGNTSAEQSKVLTRGKHTLEFDFGGVKAFAFNQAGGNIIRQVIRGTGVTGNVTSLHIINFTANGTGGVPLLNLSKAFHMVMYSPDSTNVLHAANWRSSEITSSTEITVFSTSTTPRRIMNYSYVVFEFTGNSPIVVQRSMLNKSASTGANNTVFFTPASNDTQVSLLNHGHTHNATETAIGNEEIDRIRLLNNSAWQFSSGAAVGPNSGPQENRVEIIDWNSPESIRNVQRGIVSMANLSTTVNITPGNAVNVSHTLVFVSAMESGTSAASEPPSETALRATLNDNGVIEVRRQVTGPSMEVAWELVEFNPAEANVQRIVLNFSAGTKAQNVTITPVNTSLSAAFSTVSIYFGNGNGLSDVTTTDTLNVSMFRINLINSTAVEVTRGSPQGIASVGIQVLEFLAEAAAFNVSNISLIKTDSTDPVSPGGQLTYRVNVTSTGTGTAFNVTVNDTYPPQVIFDSAQPSPLTGTNNTFVAGNLTTGTSLIINITVNVSGSVPDGVVINNTANTSFQNETSQVRVNRSATESTTVQVVVPGANLTITKIDSPDPVNASGFLNYTIRVNVTGTENVSNVTVNDTYPPQVIFLSSQPAALTGTNNSWVLGNLTVGTNFSINVSVLVNNVSNTMVINNTANVSFQNETSQVRVNRSAAQGTTVQLRVFNVTNITITKIDSPDPVDASGFLNYTIRVNVTGNGTAFNVTVNDTYPPQVIFLSSQPAALTGTNNSWVLGNLTVGTNFSINVSVLVNNVSNVPITNVVNASFQNETSQVRVNRTATQNTTVLNSYIFLNFTPPTPLQNTVTSNTSATVNISVNSTRNLSRFVFNWNGTNFTIYNNSLILMFNLDNVSALGENNTRVADAGRRSNDGIVLGNAVPNASGRYGGAFTFNGIDGRIRVPHNASQNISAQGTWMFWVNLADNNTCQSFLSKRASAFLNNSWDLGLFFAGNPDIRFEYSIDGGLHNFTNFTIPLPRSTWTHMAFVFNANDTAQNARMYRNGVEVAPDYAENPNLPIDDNISDIYVAAVNNGANCMLNGSMDEIRIWGTALPAAEIQQHYFSNLQRYNATIWAYYANQSTNTTTGLNGSYTYFGCANDFVGLENCSETRRINITPQVTEGTSGTYLVNTTNTTRFSFFTGTFNLTEFHDALDAIVLNASAFGNYTSQVFSRSVTVSWNNISWASNALGDLPANRATETSFAHGNANMSGNILLLHLNNDSSLNESGTFFFDSSGTGNHGRCGDAASDPCPVRSNGKLDGAYNFSNTVVLVNDSAALDGSLTQLAISAWVYPTNLDTTNPRPIVSKRITSTGAYPFALFFFTGNQLAVDLNGTDNRFFSNRVFTNNTWYHVLVQFDGTQPAASRVSVYVNGGFDRNATESASFIPRLANSNLTLGRLSSNANNYSGVIDEVALWNRTFTPEQIKDLYVRGAARLNLSVRSCDDALCAGESFVDVNDTSAQNLGVSANQFFQYLFEFSTDNVSVTPELYNVTIHYRERAAPTIAQVILNTTNPLTNDTNENLTAFIINATDQDGNRVRNISDWRVDNLSIAVLNMPFEGGSNSTFTRDYSIFGSNGTVSGAFWNQTGGFDGGGAYQFDGVNDDINASNHSSLVLLGNVSVVVWAFRLSNATEQTFVYFGENGELATQNHLYQFYSLPDNRLRLEWEFGTGTNVLINSTSTVSNPTGSWVFYSASRDGTAQSVTFYENGVQLGAVINYSQGPTDGNGGKLYIGEEAGGQTPFNGTLDEVRVYSRPLSAAQMRLLFENKTGVISADETDTGDIWQICVTPNDRTVDGNTVCSNNVTITAPFIINFTNVSVAKADFPDPVSASGFLNYTINVTANGNGTAYNATVTEVYPAQVIFLSAQPSPASGNATFIAGNLTAGSLFQINISVLVHNGTEGLTIVNTANVSFQNETSQVLVNRSATQSTTVRLETPAVNIYREQPDGAGTSQIINVRFVVWNNDTSTVNISAATLVDDYPGGWQVTGLPTEFNVTNNGNNVTFHLGSILTDGVVTVNYSLRANDSTRIDAFSARMNFTFSGANTSTTAPDNFSIQVNGTKAFFDAELDVHTTLQDINRTIFNNTQFNARITLKNTGGLSITPSIGPVQYLWYFNRTLWNVSSPSCAGGYIQNFTTTTNLSAINCTFATFPTNMTANITFTINTTYTNAEEQTTSNTTADPILETFSQVLVLNAQQPDPPGTIRVTEAWLLDENRTRVEDLTGAVREQDNAWTAPVQPGGYVRATFEHNLTADKDITVIAQSEGEGALAVYPAGAQSPVASIGGIRGAGTYKTLLSNLTAPADTFDLGILQSPVSFDRIVDPPPSAKRLILIGIDGMQHHHYTVMLAAGNLSNFTRLMSRGGRNTTHNITGHTTLSTAPGNAEFYTGLNSSLTGITDNTCDNPVPNSNTTFERLEAFNSSIVTGVIYGKDTCYIPDGVLRNARADINWFDNRSTYTNTQWTDGTACAFARNASTRAREFTANHSNQSFFLALYFGTPDCSGHVGGDNSANYNNSFIEVDRAFGILLDDLRDKGIENDTQILITTDHGWNEGTTGHSTFATDNLILPLITNNASMIANATTDGSREQCEIAPTVLHFFGMAPSQYQDMINNGCSSMFGLAAVDRTTFLVNRTGGVTPFPFPGGTFVSTFYNETSASINLNNSENGNFTSQVLNTSAANVQWVNMSWASNAMGELPDEGVSETSFGSGNINMSDIIFLYHFNNGTEENATLVRDFSGRGLNATCNTGQGPCPVFTPAGYFSAAYNYSRLTPEDNNTHFVAAGGDHPALSLYPNATFAVWAFYSGAVVDDHKFLDHSSIGVTAQWNWGITDDVGSVGAIRFAVNSGAFNGSYSNSVVSTGVWHHIAFVRTGGSVTFYLDGNPDGTKPINNATLINPNFELWIGEEGLPSALDEGWNGTIDELAYWNRSLAAGEIRELYRRGVTRLNFSARSCNDAACAGESYEEINDRSMQNLSVSNNTFFQYQVVLNSTNANFTPELYNVTLNFRTGAAAVAGQVYVETIERHFIRARQTPAVVVFLTVRNLSPVTNAQFLINETVNITANVTAVNTLGTVRANITLPNGTNILVQLLNQSRDIFNISWLNLTQRGRYNVTFIANDTLGNAHSETTLFFVRRAFNVLDATEVLNNSIINYSVNVISNVSGTLNFTLFLNRSTLKFMNVSDHREDSVNSIVRVGQAINESNVYAERSNFSIDVSLMNFSRINVTATAVFDRIYKCADFNRSLEQCVDRCADGTEDGDCPVQAEGLWSLLNNVTLGQNYTFLLTNSTDPGFAGFNASSRENESNTTSTTPVTAIQANFTPSTTQQFLLIGYTELQGSTAAQDVRADFILNDTFLLGNQSWQPDTSRTGSPPGDYQPFFSHRTMNLTLNLQNLTVRTYAEAGQTTFSRRARSIAVGINTSDADFNESNETFVQLAPAGTFLGMANLSFTPRTNQTLLVLASAEITPNSTSQSVSALLLMNGTEIGFAELEGEAVSDVELFATHVIVNATANVTQNFTLQAQSETAANKSVRRARITVVPLNEGFFNQSEGNTITTSAALQNKTAMVFNVASTQEYLIVASADVNISSATNGNFLGVHLSMDGEPQGNMTWGGSDTTDDASFITVRQMNLSAGSHTALLTFRREVGSAGIVNIRRARITVIPIAVGQPDIFVNASEIFFNVSHSRETENITINATIRNLGSAAANNFHVQFFDNNRTQIGGNLTIGTIAAGSFVVVNVTYITIIGNRTILVAADYLNNVTETNETNNNATAQLNVQSTTFFAGGLAGSNLTLDSALNQTKFNFGFNDAGGVYFFDIDASFNLTHLQALGRNRSGAIAFNDFGDADFILGSQFFNDSVRVFWTGGDNGTANMTRTMEVSNNTIANIPVINTTANGTFVTGILWDTNDDDDGEFDTTDREDLVFVGNINVSQDAGFGDGLKSDYAVRVPSLVRALRITRNQTAAIVELR